MCINVSILFSVKVKFWDIKGLSFKLKQVFFFPQGGLCFSGFSDSLGQLCPGSLIRGHTLSDIRPVGINLRMKVKQTYPSAHLPTHPSMSTRQGRRDSFSWLPLLLPSCFWTSSPCPGFKNTLKHLSLSSRLCLFQDYLGASHRI